MSAFNYSPRLGSEILQLRPIVQDDYSDLYLAAKDPLIWEQHPAKYRYQRGVFDVYFNEALKENALIVIDSQSGQVIGSSRYYDFDENRSKVEIGWSFLVRSHWGGTYNREMKRLMLEYAFKYVETVVFIIGKNNLRSRKAVEKIGGELQPKKVYRNDLENVVYNISKTRYGESGMNPI